MIDAVVRATIEEAIGFLSPGDYYPCEVNEHAITFVRTRIGQTTATDRRYLVICTDCRAALEVSAPLRRAFLAAHEHTKPKEA